MASDIIENMRDAYEKEGAEGDFEDGERYLRDDAPVSQLLSDLRKWCPEKKVTDYL
jgi:hypothetical protein